MVPCFSIKVVEPFSFFIFPHHGLVSVKNIHLLNKRQNGHHFADDSFKRFQWQYWYSNSNVIEVYSWGVFDRKQPWLGDGLGPNRWQAITWITDHIIDPYTFHPVSMGERLLLIRRYNKWDWMMFYASVDVWEILLLPLYCCKEGPRLLTRTSFNPIGDKLLHNWKICGMKLLIYSKTSTVLPLKFENGWINSSRTLLRKLIHVNEREPNW